MSFLCPRYLLVLGEGSTLHLVDFDSVIGIDRRNSICVRMTDHRSGTDGSRPVFIASKRQSRHDVNLWIVPLQISLAAVALFIVTMTPDMLAAYDVIHIPDWFAMGGIDDARAILSATVGCVSTVLALIFSVALLVLSMVANLFGPRLLYRFVQDWVTQVCIGLFMAALIYVFLISLVTHKDEHTSFMPQVSLITSWFVVLAAFWFFTAIEWQY